MISIAKLGMEHLRNEASDKSYKLKRQRYKLIKSGVKRDEMKEIESDIKKWDEKLSLYEKQSEKIDTKETEITKKFWGDEECNSEESGDSDPAEDPAQTLITLRREELSKMTEVKLYIIHLIKLNHKNVYYILF